MSKGMAVVCGWDSAQPKTPGEKYRWGSRDGYQANTPRPFQLQHNFGERNPGHKIISPEGRAASSGPDVQFTIPNGIKTPCAN